MAATSYAAAAVMAGRNDTAETSGTDVDVVYRPYQSEEELPAVMTLIDQELSEPYSIFTYRYFLHSWPHLCFLARAADHVCGVIICKQDKHGDLLRGYLAMLVVDKKNRGRRIGSKLAEMAISEMVKGGCDEVVLEAEVDNVGALVLYYNLGFIRDKRLHRYYLNGQDAYRLKLLLPPPEERDGNSRQQQLNADGQDPAQLTVEKYALKSLPIV